MVQSTLVANQITDGQRLIDQLGVGGIDVSAAGWVRVSEDDQWFLYIASPLVEDDKLARAYKEVYGVMRTMSGLWVEQSQVKLITPANPIAKDMADIRDHSTATIPIRYQGPRLGSESIAEAFIYPTTQVTS